MKKILFIILFITTSLYLYSKPVSIESASIIARNFYQNFCPNSVTDYSVKNNFALSFEDENLLLITNFNSGGWVVVPLDDAEYPILAYSFNSVLVKDSLSEHMSIVFNMYLEHINFKKYCAVQDTQFVSIWSKMLNNNFNRSFNTPVPSLLETNQTSRWSGWPPYFFGAPNDDGWDACVPLAYAQIIKYWEYPEKPSGQSSYTTYNSNNHTYTTWSIDFNLEPNYNYNLMPYKLSNCLPVDGNWNWLYDPQGGPITSPEAKEVGRLQYHCGMAVKMNWHDGVWNGQGNPSSGCLGDGDDWTPEIVSHFSYSPDWDFVTSYNYSGNPPDIEFKQKIRNDLNNGIPVFFRIGYHAIVIDGYQDDGFGNFDFFHFIQGRAGADYGYFYLYDDDDDGNHGVPPSSSYSAVFNLQPNPCGINSNIQQDYIIDNQTIIWDHKKYGINSITINNGGVLVIKDKACLINNGEIIINQGGKLIIDGGIITNICNSMWMGITVKGDQYASQLPYSNQGMIAIRNGGTIEHALTAIRAESGAVVHAFNSTFRNNQNDIWFEPYNNNSQVRDNYSYIKVCDFLTEGLFNDVNKYPHTHITLDNIDGITIKNCTFKNDRDYNIQAGESIPSLNANYRGIGIHAINSSFKVLPSCSGIYQLYGDLCPNPDRCVFKGLYYAIKSSDVTSSKAVTIKQSVFKENFRGILLEHHNTPNVWDNKIESTYEGPGLDIVSPYPPPYFKATYGLYLNECTGYRIEENRFTYGDAGTIINNSGFQTNEIYLNEYDSIENPSNLDATAIVAMEINHNLLNMSGSGLQFYCDEFYNNEYNMAVLDNSSIAKFQGEYNPTSGFKPTGNKFNENCTSGEYDFYISSSSPINNYEYYYYDSNPDEEPGCVSSNLQPYPTVSSNSCESELDQTLSLPVLELEFQEKQGQAITLQNELDNLVDGGNTQQLLNKVANISHRNYWRTCADLIDASPFLSDTVLVSFMENDIRRPVAKTLVLMANSPLPSYPASKIEDLNINRWFKQLLESLQDGTNPREQKETELSSKLAEKQNIINDMIGFTLYEDSIAGRIDTLINILYTDNDYNTKFNLIPLLIKEERYSEAQSELNSLQSFANSSSFEMQEKLSYYTDFMSIVKDYHENNLDTSIVSSNISFLQELAEAENTPGNIGAQILLENYSSNYNYPEKIEFPGIQTKSMSVESSNSFTDSEEMDDLIMVYPNPADNVLTVEYVVINGFNNGKLQIYNMQGKLMYSRPLQKQLGVKEINVRDFPNGNYIISVGSNGIDGYNKQISIMH